MKSFFLPFFTIFLLLFAVAGIYASIRIQKDKLIFTCPLDNTETVYKNSKNPADFQYLSSAGTMGFRLEQLNEFGYEYADFSFDKTLFCKKHSPDEKERCFILNVKKKNGSNVKTRLDYHHNLALLSPSGTTVKDRMEYISRTLIVLVNFLEQNTGNPKPLKTNDPFIKTFLGLQ